MKQFVPLAPPVQKIVELPGMTVLISLRSAEKIMAVGEHAQAMASCLVGCREVHVIIGHRAFAISELYKLGGRTFEDMAGWPDAHLSAVAATQAAKILWDARNA